MDKETDAVTSTQETGTQVYRVYIKASAQAIWDAIVDTTWTERYAYRAPVEYDLRPGGKYISVPSEAMRAHGPAPDVLVEGEVIEVDAPRRLVQTWCAVWDPEMAAEGPKRLTWDLAEDDAGITTVTVTHELSGSPKTAFVVSGQEPAMGGGWAWILSDLKTLLETGAAMHG